MLIQSSVFGKREESWVHKDNRRKQNLPIVYLQGATVFSYVSDKPAKIVEFNLTSSVRFSHDILWKHGMEALGEKSGETWQKWKWFGIFSMRNFTKLSRNGPIWMY